MSLERNARRPPFARPRPQAGSPRPGDGGAARIAARVRELQDMGLAPRLAQQVARGERPLSEVLAEMARNDKVERIVAEHQVPRSFAMQCVLGQADLPSFLASRRRHAYRAEHGRRSSFDEAAAAATPVALALLGRTTRVLRVLAVEKYELVVQEEGAEPERLHKLRVKYLHRPDDRKLLRRALSFDKALKDAVAEPIWRIQDRLACHDSDIFPLLEGKRRVTLTTVEGERLQGTIAWYSRYEIGLELRGEAVVTVLRHALAAFGED